MGRSWFRTLSLAGGLFAAGCTDYGAYHVSWQFVGDEAGGGCGLHGVDSIRVIGDSTEGDHEDVSGLCPKGELTHSVPVGTWTFAVHQLDVRGVPIDVDVPMVGAVISEDATVDVDPLPVVLTPRPVCADGVDNDRDGRVDLDDLTCVTDPNAAAE